MYDSLQPELVAVSAVMLALSLLVVSLRFWSGHITPQHSFGLDDLFAALTVPFMLAQNALVFVCIALGLGRPAATVPDHNQKQIHTFLFAASFFFSTAITLPKLSVLSFYLRIFGQIHRWFYVSLWVLATLNVAWLAASYLLTALQCRPVAAAWRPVPGAQCIPQWAWLAGLAAPSMLIDLVLLVLPMLQLWRIQAPLQRKIAMTMIFACGYCVLTVSLGRLATLANARAALSADPTRALAPYLAWAQAEAPVSLFAICVPALVQLAHRLRALGPSALLPGRPPRPPRPPPKDPAWLAAAVVAPPLRPPRPVRPLPPPPRPVRPPAVRASVNFSKPRAAGVHGAAAQPGGRRARDRSDAPQGTRWGRRGHERRVHFLSDMVVGPDGRLYNRG